VFELLHGKKMIIEGRKEIGKHRKQKIIKKHESLTI